jgi:hypothetical protein
MNAANAPLLLLIAIVDLLLLIGVQKRHTQQRRARRMANSLKLALRLDAIAAPDPRRRPAFERAS